MTRKKMVATRSTEHRIAGLERRVFALEQHVVESRPTVEQIGNTTTCHALRDLLYRLQRGETTVAQNKIQLIKIIRAFTNYGLKEVKDLVEQHVL